jgi:signal transduction histidine kinase
VTKAQSATRSVTAAKGPARARILLVDDDERNLMALAEVLRDLAEVVTARSGREALRQLLKGEFAVILLDVFMPELDGYETASLVREREQTARIPIIFLSAVNKETEHLMRGYAMGAVDYVFKPVDPLILKSKVGVFVDLFNMRVQVEETGRAEQELREANFKAEVERLQIARELQETREREAAIIQSLPMLLYLEPLSAEPRRPDFISGDMEAMTGFQFNQVQSDPHIWERRIHPEDRDRVMVALRARRETGRFSIEYRWQCADGGYKHFLDQSVLVKDSADGITEFAGTLTDVTDQRMLEGRLLQSQKMDAIGQLTGGIAHDFNNLLSAVLGGLHLLERRVVLEQRDKLILDQMRHAAEQGAELVRRMMAFARKQDLSPTSVDPQSLVASVAGLVEHALAGTIEIDWRCSNDVDNLFVDRSQLELALVNLILNARDAMPGGGRISVAIDSLETAVGLPDLASGRYVRICVSDHGQGIPDEIVNRITEPFFTTKESGKGTGLGLSMVAGFVEQSGGRLRIESKAGEGAVVELILPSTRLAAPAEAERPPEAQSASTNKAVLLVDDDDAVRTVLGEQLRELGFAVDEESNGRSAIERLKRNGGYDVLLTDFAMPGMNGLDTIKSAVSQRPSINALLMTGYADEEAVAGVRETVPVLRKPIDLNELIRRIA